MVSLTYDRPLSQYQNNRSSCDNRNDPSFFRIHFFHGGGLKLRHDQICKKKHQHNDHDHNSRKGVDGGIDALCHIIYNNGYIFYSVSGNKVGNYEIVKGHGKGQERSRKNPFFDHGHDNLGKCLIWRCTKIHGCIGKVRIQASYLRIYTGDHIGRTKCDMCQQHGQIAFRHSQRRKQQHQTNRGYDLRIQNWKVIDGKDHLLQNLSGF